MKVKIGPYRKSGKERKIKIKIHKHDTINLDSTLALVIKTGLEKFKNRKYISTPMFCFDEDYENVDEDEKKALENEANIKWLGLLDEMIYGFDISQQEKDEEKLYKEYSGEQLTEQLKKHWDYIIQCRRVFADNFGALWT